MVSVVTPLTMLVLLAALLLNTIAADSTPAAASGHTCPAGHTCPSTAKGSDLNIFVVLGVCLCVLFMIILLVLGCAFVRGNNRRQVREVPSPHAAAGQNGSYQPMVEGASGNNMGPDAAASSIETQDDNPKARWPTFMLIVWQSVLLVLLVVGAILPQVGNRTSVDVTSGTKIASVSGWGFFTISASEECSGSCTGISGPSKSIAIADWDLPTGCNYKRLLEAASGFAILAILAAAVALILVVTQDLVRLFRVHRLFTGIVAGVGWLFTLITWAIVAALFNTALCGEKSLSQLTGYSYFVGFFLFVSGWALTTLVLAVWFFQNRRTSAAGGLQQ